MQVSIISRGRDELLDKLIRQCQVFASEVSVLRYQGPTDSDFETKKYYNGLIYSTVDTEPKSLGSLRNLTANALTDTDELILFLDDDISLSADFIQYVSNCEYYIKERMCADPDKFGLFQIPEQSRALVGHNPPNRYSAFSLDNTPIVTTAGGVIVNKVLFERVGGFGDDYFDFPELSLKMIEAGAANYRVKHPYIYNKHDHKKLTTKTGLAAWLPEAFGKSCHHLKHKSKILDNYPNLVSKCKKCSLGFAFNFAATL